MKAPMYVGAILLWMMFMFLSTGLMAQVTTLSNWTNVYHGTSASAQTSTVTIPTGSGSYRLLVVAIASSRTTSGSVSATITYGGRTLTSVGGDFSSTGIQQHTAFYYLKESDIDLASNTTLSIAVSGGTIRVNDYWVASFDYVNQTTPIADNKNANSSSNSTSLTMATSLSIAAGNLPAMVVSAFRSGNTTTRTITYPTNFTMVNEQTFTTTDGVRNGVANATIPTSSTTNACTTGYSGNCWPSQTAIAIAGCSQPTANAGAALSAICKGGTSAALGGSVGGSATGGTWSDGGAGGSFSPNATTLNATYTPAASYTGTVTLTLTTSGGSCGTNTASKTLSVNPLPTAVTASASVSSICSGSSINLTSAATSNSGTSATPLTESFNTTIPTWTLGNSSTGGTVANAAWTLRASGYNDGNETFTTSDATQFIISSSDLQGSGGTTNTSLTSPAFNTTGLSAANINLSHYYRYNAGTDDRAFVEVSTNGSTWTTLATYSSTQGTASAFATPTIALTAGFLNQATVYVRFRYTASFDWYWAINSVSITGTYTSAPAATFSWTSSPAGFTSSTQNPTGVSPTVNTTYTVTATNSYGCTATASTSSVTVNTSPAAPTGSGGSRCGAGTVTLNATVGSGVTVDWYADATGGTALSGGTGTAAFTTPSLSATTTYYAEARNSTSGCLSSTRTAFTVAISTPPSISNQTGSSTYGTATSYTLIASNATSYSATGLPSGFSLNSATGVISIAANAAAGNFSITVTALAAGCSNASATLTYTRNTAALSITANNITKCYGTNYTLGSTAFTSSGLQAGDVISSVTLSSDGADIFADLGTYDIVISNATGASFSASNYNITYNNGTMTVVDVPSFTQDPSANNQTVCLNQSATALSVVALAGSGTISGYQWYVNSVSSSFGGTLISGATSSTYSPTTSTAGTYYYYCIVTNSNGCTALSNVSGSLTVNALPTVVSVTGGGAVCNNTLLSASNGSSGTIYYQGTTSGGTSIATPSTSQTVSTSGTYYFRAQSAAGCWGPEGSAVVTIQAPQISGVTICQGAASTAMTSSASCPTTTGLTAGPNDATTGTGTGWTTPGNIGAAGTASISVAANSSSSNLQGTGYGFNIPSYATITGITVTISRQSSSTSTTTNLRDNVISLVKGGVVQATNKATSTQWTNTLTAVSYGGSADLWGGAWTPADINASNFGVVLSATNLSTTTARTATIDYMRITVTYSTVGTLNWYSVSSGGSSLGSGASFNPVGVAGSGLLNTNTAGSVPYYVECSLNPGCRGTANYVINALPTISSVSNGSRCGTGAVSISAAASSGAVIDWYADASGGSALSSGSTSYTTPSISATTVYYAQARNTTTGCISGSRTAVSAIVKSASSSSTTISACDSYTWNGNTYTSSGIYTWTGTNAAGCDSVATLNLTITVSTSHSNTVSACDSYTWAENGQTYTSSGTYTAVTGCHTEILNLTITSSTSNTTTISACDSYTWSVNGQTYTSSGIYSDVNNCHTEILNLTITSSSSDTTVISACDSYTWSANTQTYTNSGTYTSVTGCHTKVLILTVTESTTHTNTVTAGGSYTWAENNQTYTASGTYTAVTGCHTEVLNLTIVPLTSDTTTISACDSYTWAANNQTYTSSGTYSYTSGYNTSYLALTITASSSNTINVSVCDSYTWSVNGQTYTSSGTYTDLDNCHTEVLNLTITSSTSNTTNASVCDSYTWSVNGQAYTSSGTYTSVSGCHTEVLNLTITASTSHSNTVSACDSYTWSENGQTYTSSGTYTAVTGCHTEVLNLTITASSTNTSIVSVCDSYTWSVNGQTYTTSGTYTDVDNCHTEILNLTITNSSVDTTSVSACESYTWSVNGQTYTSSGIYTSVSGCHTNVLVLSISTPTNAADYETACDSYTWNGVTYTSSGTYTHATACGTDTLVLTINNSTHNVYTQAACGNYSWNGSNYAASGVYVYNYTNTSGCASADTLYLTVNPLPTVPGAVTGVTEVCTIIGNTTPTVFTTTGVQDAVSYNWIVPNGATIASGQGTTSIGVTFDNTLASTNQLIRVASVSADGCYSAYSNITLTKTIPAIPAAIFGPTDVCAYMGQATTATYYVDSVPNANSYTWVAPTGASIVSGQGSRTVTVSYTSGFTSGSIKVTAVGNCGSRVAKSMTISRLIPSVPVSISGPTSVCAFIGTNTQVTYSVAAVANASSYTWVLPSGVNLVSGQGTNTIVVTYSSSYTTNYIRVNAVSNCFTTGYRSLQVSAASYGIPGVITGPTNACPYIANDGLATYSIRKVANAGGYIWTVPAGVTIVQRPGSGANDTLIRVSYGTNYVSGSSIVVQATGCGVSAPRSLAVNGIIVSTPGLISGPTNACQFMVSASQPNGNIATYTIRKVAGATAYNWVAPANASIIAHPGGVNDNDTIVQVKFNQDFVSGSILVSASNACGGSGNRSLSITRLNPATPGDIDVVQTSVCPNRTYTYTVAAMPLNANSIVWTVPYTGTIVSGQGTTSITVSYPPAVIAGDVTAQAFNNCSSSSIRSVKVKISSCPTSFTGNSGSSQTTKGSTATSPAFEVNVFPNPSQSDFKLQWNSTSAEPLKISIRDMQGRLISQSQTSAAGLVSVGQQLKPGNYIIEIVQGSNRKTVKVVKL